jgi:hypothetical protein
MKKWSIEQECCACLKFTENGSVLHHIYTRAARSDLQLKPWNLMPLCVNHHNEIHNRPLSEMAEKYSGVMKFLIDNEWMLDEFTKKWFNYRAQRGFYENNN